ncbi:hypothetical protein ACKWTF_013682 [Chironomus riparius]
MIRELLLVQILLIFSFHKSDAKLTVECIVDYLKFKHFDTDYFSSVNKYDGNPTDCTNEIRSQNENFYNEVRTKFTNHVARKEYADCAVKEVKAETQFENYRLAALGAEMKGVGLKFWKSGDKNKYIQENQNKALELENNGLVNCQGRKKYGEFFNSFYEQKKSEQLTVDFEYCLRKYLGDNNIIKHNQYGFSTNMIQAARSRGIRCDDIMRVTKDQMKAQISADGAEACTVERFVANGYLDEILKVQMLSKLEMTASEKEAEKENFIKKMISLTNLIKSCPLPLH